MRNKKTSFCFSIFALFLHWNIFLKKGIHSFSPWVCREFIPTMRPMCCHQFFARKLFLLPWVELLKQSRVLNMLGKECFFFFSLKSSLSCYCLHFSPSHNSLRSSELVLGHLFLISCCKWAFFFFHQLQRHARCVHGHNELSSLTTEEPHRIHFLGTKVYRSERNWK